ncbi:7,8-dihydropterin-6-yl-methyl-4-(beta-D-ribofuranosyl)aminobenzene 5'-phosphate synthase [Geothermobacter ehrlichii]|uniref:7, 8-dihydropterin-6-yl-methyl-4-(Beta-D-ribofuranosyl)aminobenzene 5'-phosphate synthase n=1 Tax=Geothermobacter ehrlichii TaxID=213224 RepID=A0A5D3WIH3_9BACT|nr:MBL fold metallo-hydrolase [Geothermobacter ehrlichii]TYO97600.1 7,8-dihydropterin-6-yl-methyl-4-(beta-D-ribofuranosyl)aminobenzene 5'-phosphate synthase [Geothermobacter ehrlichii]
MQVRVTVLCENSVASPFGVVGEHGWAVWIETDAGSWLFDTGQGVGLRNNAAVLGVDLAQAQGIVLSHGHYDHTAGLPTALGEQDGSVQVFAHPDLFLSRYWKKEDRQREIGLRYTRPYLEGLGARFDLATGFRAIAPGIYLTGEVPRTTPFEPVDPAMKLRDADGCWHQDPLLDDQALVVDTAAGLLVVLGCAHAGLINTLQHVRASLPGRPIHTVIGGTHLGFAEPAQLEATLDHLDSFGIRRLGASHCTGLANGARLAAALGDRYFFAAAGCRFELG